MTISVADGAGPALVILAAGRSTRYGAPKPLVPIGPHGETLPEYTVYDAIRAGFGRIILVVHPDTGAAIENHLRARLPASIRVTFAIQRDPPGARPRHKPWGTGAAIVAAAPHLDGPFAVVNADDLYGRDALSLAADHLGRRARKESGLVAYRLNETLSAAGGVSRAVCTLGAGNRLLDIEEVLDLRRTATGIKGHTARDAASRTLLGNELVSMNLWAFQRAMADRFSEAYPRFLAEHEGDAQAEFLIGEVVGDLVRRDAVQVRVLACAARWLGITYHTDRPSLARALEELSAAGVYPSPLFAELHGGSTRESSNHD